MTQNEIEQAIDARPISGFALSISTGIALERVAEPVLLSEVNHNSRIKIDTLVVDISTLVRNLLSSLDSETIKALINLPTRTIVNMVATRVANEATTISHIIRTVIVKPNYQIFDKCMYGKPTDTISYRVKELTRYITDSIDIIKQSNITGTSALLTHNAITLVEYQSKVNMLLQSHTGNVIYPNGYTKLLKPFGRDKCLDVKLSKVWIMILGDTAGMINAPILNKYKRRLKIEALEDYRKGKSINRAYVYKFLKEISSSDKHTTVQNTQCIIRSL